MHSKGRAALMVAERLVGFTSLGAAYISTMVDGVGPIERAIAFCQRHAFWVVASTVLIVVGAAIFASRLRLQTTFVELLPSKDPGVVELRRLTEHIGGIESLIVAIRSPSKEANLRYARAVTERIRALPPDLVEIVRFEVQDELAFFKRNRWLYASHEDLTSARDALHNEILRRENPLYVPLDDNTWAATRDRLAEHTGVFPQLPDGIFMSSDGALVAVVVVPPGGLFGSAGDRMHKAVRSVVARLDPHSFHPGLSVRLAGDVVTQIEEHRALEADLAGATILTILLVGIVVYAFFGRLRALPLMATPALVGVTLAFAVAEGAFGYLNSSTAFLGAIILGNGINYAIIQLARYEEERQAGRDAATAGVRAVVGTVRATAVAAVAASIAYGSLMLTRFRGFSQFGLIGGAGMIFAWLATLIVLPAMLYLLDRNRPPRPGRPGAPGLRIAAPLGRLAHKHPRSLLLFGAILTLGALVALPHLLGDPFEYNFRNLRTARRDDRSENRELDQIFGRLLSPAIILTDRVEEAPLVVKAIREKDRALSGHPLLQEVVEARSLLPGTIAEQERKLERLSEIRTLLHSKGQRLLTAAEREELSEWEPPTTLKPIALKDLPPLILRPFRERDGTVGRVVLAFPVQRGFSSWNGRDLIRMANVLGEVRLPDGRIVRSSGHAVVFAAMIRSIVHDAPIATGVSIAGVALLVLLLSPTIAGALTVIVALIIGVVWMVGAASLMGERVNFLNFIALPITFGIGVDYGINLYLRYRLEGRGGVGAAVTATGGAVALCSATTVIGYGSLLFAANRALRSFGRMAVLGELATLAAALVLLPAYLTWREDRQRLRSTAPKKPSVPWRWGHVRKKTPSPT